MDDTSSGVWPTHRCHRTFSCNLMLYINLYFIYPFKKPFGCSHAFLWQGYILFLCNKLSELSTSPSLFITHYASRQIPQISSLHDVVLVRHTVKYAFCFLPSAGFSEAHITSASKYMDTQWHRRTRESNQEDCECSSTSFKTVPRAHKIIG